MRNEERLECIKKAIDKQFVVGAVISKKRIEQMDRRWYRAMTGYVFKSRAGGSV